MEIIEGSNIDMYIQLVLAIIGLASVIVKITPTPKDDAVLGKVKTFISKFVALNPKE